MQVKPNGLTIPAVTHHRIELNGTRLHYVFAGQKGSPILLVHGFPETWWAFHKLIPLLGEHHRVFAVDLRGFGDSGVASDADDSSTSAEDLHQLIQYLGVGPVHVVGQDISGAAVYRLAANYPDDVASLTAIEMGLAGFGQEAFADVTHGGTWHIGALVAPGVAKMMLVGREKEFLTYFYGSMCKVPQAVIGADIEEFARSYARDDGWQGAIGLYRSMLGEGAEIKSIAEARKVAAPVLAVGASGGAFTAQTMSQAIGTTVRTLHLEDVGHYVALEVPDKLADEILKFTGEVDTRAR